MGCWCAAPVFLIILLVLNLEVANGKRGCANFGHSCYGGMGKRALNEMLPKFVHQPSMESRLIGHKLYIQPNFRSLDHPHLLRQWILSRRRTQLQEFDKNLI